MSDLPPWSVKIFRPAAKRSVVNNLVRMVLQTATMWGVFLGVLPAAVLWMQAKFRIPSFDPGPWGAVAIGVFVCAGALGLYCGLMFVFYGDGTPLPLDHTTKLVVIGPYRVIRNPMAVLGILQGAMVGLWLGSWPVIVYAVCGILAWNFLARPSEERDMAARYGSEYQDYVNDVPCWFPTFKPFRRIPPLTQPDQSTDLTD